MTDTTEETATITTNVEEDTFELAANILTAYTANLLAHKGELDGEAVAELLAQTVRDVTYSGAEGLISVVYHRILESYNEVRKLQS